MDADLSALREETDVFAHQIKRHEQAAESVLVLSEESNIVHIPKISEVAVPKLQLIEV